ncbi:MAG: ABC transporter ATP-binding protein [Calditrichaeota bacterium]|nr:ABC transporter ATP-binding protein [Calditrichota bacterium]
MAGKQKNKSGKSESGFNYRTLIQIYKSFSNIYRHHWKLLLVSYTGLISRILVALLLPWPIKLILDYVILKAPLPSEAQFLVPYIGSDLITLLLFLVVSYVVLRVIQMMVSYMHKVGLLTVGEKMTAEIREKIFRRLQSLSLSFHGKKSSSDLLYRLTSDITKLQTVLVIFPDTIIHRFLVIFSHLGIMFYYNWKLALLASVIIPVIYFYNRIYGSNVEDAVEEKRKKESDVSEVISENVSAMALIQAYGRQDDQHTRFSELNRAGLEHEIEAMRLSKIFQRLNDIIMALGMAIVVAYGGWLVLDGVLLPGTLVLFTYYVRNLYRPIRKLAEMILEIGKAQVSGRRLLELFNAHQEIADAPNALEAPPFSGRMAFENVTFGYDTNKIVLNNLSFTVEPGETIALVGHSGAGKSTIINLLMRFYDPQTGRITADNHDIKSLKIKSLRDQITILMQEAQLFYKSVAENIAFGKEGATTEEIIRAAKLAQAHDFIENMPNGYETMIEEGGENLSGGQKQRINIARAMIRNTPILILDEPTTALDAKSESLVHDAINVLTRGKTTFVIAHKLSTIRDADKILVLDKGQMVGLGKHDELLENCEPYRQLCRWQFGMGIDTAPELSGIAETAPLKP